MGRLKVENKYTESIDELMKKENEIRHIGLKKRLATIRLIMAGSSGNEVARCLNISRHSVSKYVKIFNNGGINELLKRYY